MFVLNSCAYDSRVRREAASLSAAGYEVCVFALAADGKTPGRSFEDGYVIHRLHLRSSMLVIARKLRELVVSIGRRLPFARDPARRAPGADEPWVGPSLSSRSGTAAGFLVRAHRLVLYLSFWKASLNAARIWGPAFAHAHDFNVLPGTGVIAARTGIPLVYDSHELWLHRNRSAEGQLVGSRLEGWIEGFFARRAALVMTVSDGIADWLQRHHRLGKRPLVLRNVPLPLGAPTGPSLRELAELDDAARIILYTGRITTGRGIEDAIAALPQLPEDVHLILMGYADGRFRSQLAHMMREAALEDRIRFVPAVPPTEVSSVARQAQVALVAIQPLCLSYQLSLPNKLFEALQAGVPVAATDLPEIARVVRNYDCGLLFSPGNGEELRSALMSVLEDQERFRRGARTAAAELHWGLEEKKLLDAYSRLLSLRGEEER